MSPPGAEAPEPEGAPSSGEELSASVQQDLMRLEVFREQLTALVREQELLRVSLESHARARQTLEALENFQKDREMLVPVGAETFVQALPRSTEKVLVGVGHGIVVELERAKALEILARRQDELQKGDQGLAQQLRRVENEVAQLQARLQEVYQEAQQARAAADPGASSSSSTSSTAARPARRTPPRSY
ncbi:MAG: prefoldin subunit alpha [Euryarchaeota archaeon]|nr:prefoldin subunit alpha [Euryarchaeota archaeon]MDE1881438.1 prefoldin subunit alpha [Euryarchaeota archaeon]MDE2046319.1 prefoldin subunit alpha [Thermoplasmata archaeon]